MILTAKSNNTNYGSLAVVHSMIR